MATITECRLAVGAAEELAQITLALANLAAMASDGATTVQAQLTVPGYTSKAGEALLGGVLTVPIAIATAQSYLTARQTYLQNALTAGGITG